MKAALLALIGLLCLIAGGFLGIFATLGMLGLKAQAQTPANAIPPPSAAADFYLNELLPKTYTGVASDPASLAGHLSNLILITYLLAGILLVVAIVCGFRFMAATADQGEPETES